MLTGQVASARRSSFSRACPCSVSPSRPDGFKMDKTLKKPHKYGRKVCIFCGRTPTTNEHIWPRWAADLLPKSIGHKRFILDGNRGAETLKIPKQLHRQGSVSTVRIERVCKGCNSGWMSAFEDGIKPLLTQMINGEISILDDKHLAILTTYLTYKLMVLDWADGDPVLPSSANHAFHDERTMPPLTSIQIANCYEGRWRNAFRSYFCAVSLPEDYIGPDQPRNLKSIALGIGNLFVFAIFSTQVDIKANFDDWQVIRLWPPTGRGHSWPPIYPISSQEAENIAVTVEKFIQTSDKVVEISG